MSEIQVFQGVNETSKPVAVPAQELVPGQFNSSAAARAESAAAMVKARFTLAMARPRDTLVSRTRLLNECRRPGFAEAARFSLPRGGQTITGWTIRFAEAALRGWGNVDVRSEVSYEDADIRKIEVSVLDLETNTAYSKEVTIEKTVESRKIKEGQAPPIGERINSQGARVYLYPATEADMLMKEGAQVSRIIRTLGLRMIPGDILEECARQIDATIRGEVKSDIGSARKRLVDAFQSLQIQPEALSTYCGKPIDQFDGENIAELRGVYTAIREEGARWSEILENKLGTREKKAEKAADSAALIPKKAKRSLGDVVKEQEPMAPQTEGKWTQLYRSSAELLVDEKSRSVAKSVHSEMVEGGSKGDIRLWSETELDEFISRVETRMMDKG